MNLIYLIYAFLFALTLGIRTYYSRKYKPDQESISQGSLYDRILLGLIGLATLFPFVYIFTGFPAIGNYSLAENLQFLGLVLFSGVPYFLYRSHQDLAENWNPEVGRNKENSLITSGIYAKVRHPMYSTFLLWGVSHLFIFPNLFVAPMLLILMVLFLPQRIKREEVFLKELYPEYEGYMKKSYALIWRLI